jgi:hypothetical protein
MGDYSIFTTKNILMGVFALFFVYAFIIDIRVYV